MSEKEIFGVIINLIGWPLIIYWLLKSRADRKESERGYAEYNRPENKFKREIQRLRLSLKALEKRNQYPYIIVPSYIDKQKAIPPEYMTGGFDRHTFRSIDEITTGKNEFLLYSSLTKRFGDDKIFIGNHSLFGFYPDILYVDKLNKIFIDIEIDEPYVLKSNEPIHFFHIGIDENDKRFLDDANLDRDKAFTKYGWTVVRFSEKQVINSALKCCEVINHIISFWTLQKTNLSLEECEIQIEKRWNKDEAKEMSISKVRQSKYLSP